MIHFLTLLATTENVDLADSAKVALSHIAKDLIENPNEFANSVLHKGLDFGLKVLAAIAIYAVGAWLIKKVGKLLRKVFARRGTDKMIVTFVTSLVSIAMTVLLVIITVGTLGVDTTSLAALLAAGGMAIGMALSGTVQNFAGGIMLLVFKPFKAGDYIKAMGYEGFVVEVNMVSTKIRTYANSIIVLPNGALSGGTIDNFSDKPYHREAWLVDVAYGSDADKVKEVLLDILRSEPRILDSTRAEVPDPAIHVNALKDSSVEFIAYGWVAVGDYWPVLYKINHEIYTRLPENGIQFPFPQLDVHIDKG